MDDRYQRAKDLFLAVCDLDAEQCKAVLDGECAGDPELRGEVESLLAHHDVSGMPTLVGPSPPARAAEGPGRVGHYRILREIGRGGMGVVYLGYREGDRFRKRVAVKVLKRGMDTEQILQRFEQEYQVLGALNHPGIARLYDAGQTEDGVPYFGMEYVDGQPIDEYCDTHRLQIAERLELFRQVCAAVQYVHQNLMVHRDLKPSNILVTGDGQPKLLDFGIAKLINPEMSLFGADPTVPELRVMTPEYASPEQVRGMPITVASDVYSLGVILYELLSGHRPYRIGSRVRAEIERVICDMAPERPSTASGRVEVIDAAEHESGVSATITPELVARVREGRPERLRRRLAGDIDNIVLMALRKEPQRRYQSAEQLSEDLRRHLEGLPVKARRDTAGYRLAKFARRHRAGVAAAAVVVLALAGWAVTAERGRRAEIRHRQVVEAHSDVLAAERDRATRALGSVLDLSRVIFSLDDDLAYDTLSAREQLARSARASLERLRPHVGDDPTFQRVLAHAHNKVGDVLGGHRGETAGDTAAALESFRAALAMWKALLAGDPRDPGLRSGLAGTHLRIGDTLRFTGDVNGALESYRKYLEIAAALAAEDPKYRRTHAIALGTVGSALKDTGRLEEAREHYERSLAVRQAILADRPDDAVALRDVGVGYVHAGEALDLLGDHEGALGLYLESIDVRERLVRAAPDNGRHRRYLALSHYFAADELLRLGRPGEAAGHVEQAVTILDQRAEYNPTSARSRQDLALAWDIRGRLQQAQGMPDGALESFGRYRDLAAVLTKTDPDHTFYQELLADSHERIGAVHAELGDRPAVIWAFRQALQVVRPPAEADRGDVDLGIRLARVLAALGGALVETGDLLEAESRLEEARMILEPIVKSRPRHARARRAFAQALRGLSRLAAARGDENEAVALAQEALAALPASGGPGTAALREKLQEQIASNRPSSD